MKEEQLNEKNFEVSEQIKKKQLRSFYNSAKNELNNGNPEKAYELFSKAQSVEGCAYCRFMQGRVEEALVLLNLVKASSPAVEFLRCLIGIINGDTNQVPTYFQIRNFYEIVMNMLFACKNYDYAKKIFEKTSYLALFNKEVYKFTARIFLDNNAIENAVTCLKKSINVYYNDPEVHFMLGEAYFALGNTLKAKEEYKKSNEVTGGYFPASEKLKELI